MDSEMQVKNSLLKLLDHINTVFNAVASGAVEWTSEMEETHRAVLDSVRDISFEGGE